MECTDCVRVSTCRVLHDQLEKRCAEKHLSIDHDREAFKKEIRDVFIGRANERAWGLVGKILLAVLGIYTGFNQMLELLHKALK